MVPQNEFLKFCFPFTWKSLNFDRDCPWAGLQVHGVLNAVSWGTLMPLGAMIARYLKVFKSADPAWFYLHIACQSSAYVVGVAGWATGLKLGSDSPGTQYDGHRNIGIALFCLGTLQVLPLISFFFYIFAQSNS